MIFPSPGRRRTSGEEEDLRSLRSWRASAAHPRPARGSSGGAAPRRGGARQFHAGLLQGDIKRVSLLIARIARCRSVGLLVSGPPCTPFSAQGKRLHFLDFRLSGAGIQRCGEVDLSPSRPRAPRAGSQGALPASGAAVSAARAAWRVAAPCIAGFSTPGANRLQVYQFGSARPILHLACMGPYSRPERSQAGAPRRRSARPSAGSLKLEA